MTRWETFQELRKALRAPDRLGDVAVLKGELGRSRVRPEIEAELAAMSDPFPEVDLPSLAALPRGTLGREYAEFLSRCGLEPFRLSGTLPEEMLRKNLFVVRYGFAHDVFHVLTGFDTTLAGELGVWSFVAGQRYHWGHRLAVAIACLLYPLMAPRQIPRMWANRRRGYRMGRRAQSLISVPFERMWSRSIKDLRTMLDVEAADELEQVVLEPTAA